MSCELIQSEVFDFMGETRNTFTEVKERLAKVEKQAVGQLSKTRSKYCNNY